MPLSNHCDTPNGRSLLPCDALLETTNLEDICKKEQHRYSVVLYEYSVIRCLTTVSNNLLKTLLSLYCALSERILS